MEWIIEGAEDDITELRIRFCKENNLRYEPEKKEFLSETPVSSLGLLPGVFIRGLTPKEKEKSVRKYLAKLQEMYKEKHESKSIRFSYLVLLEIEKMDINSMINDPDLLKFRDAVKQKLISTQEEIYDEAMRRYVEKLL